jgi:D-3-phosphoglycerate dehydrogenase
MKILIADKFNDQLPIELARFGEVTSDLAVLPEADALLIRSKTKATAEFLAPAANLKLIIRGGVGIDNIDCDYCRGKGVIVRNTPEASSPAVAELAIGLMLSFARNISEGDATMKQGAWEKKRLGGSELLGKTLGLVGCGRIALEVARRAAAFGMDVIGFKRTPPAPPPIQLVDSLEEIWKRSDYISLHIPATPETINLINAETISKMKNGAILINTARGKCINEEDLAKALTYGHIRGAGLDVFCSEPPEGSPLLSAPHCVLTPHLGASTGENMERIKNQVVRLISELAEGRLKSV